MSNKNETSWKSQEFLEILSGIDNVNDDFRNNLRKSLKSTYDYMKLQEGECRGESNAFPHLIIANFDTEQISQQLKYQNEEFSPKLQSLLPDPNSTDSGIHDVPSEGDDIGDDENSEDSEVDEPIKNDSNEEESDDENDMVDDDEADFLKDEDSSDDENDMVDDDEADFLEDEDSNFEDEKPENGDANDSEPRNKFYKKSAVDDDFFCYQELEEFLEHEDKKELEHNDGSDDEENEIDYFAREPDENSEAIMAKFKDFFRPNNNYGKEEHLNKPDDDNNPENLSKFELRQNRLQQKIDDLEAKAIAEKPWTLKGEIRADSRPINSLLEEDVDFDRATRAAPIVTGKTTRFLEDIIKDRIKNRAYDDVQKKERSVQDDPIAFKKNLVLNQEKSKLSLAQIYEKEYLAELESDHQEKDVEETELHKEIKTSLQSLFKQLDALSNYHFTPKPSLPELKMVTNVPVLFTEEVLPVAISDAPLLAPEEVKPSAKGDIKGNSEKTSTDKKRERRKKKAKQSYHAKLKEEKTKNMKTNPKSKGKDKDIINLLTRDKNTKSMTPGENGPKSSKAFFAQLENKQQLEANNNKRKGSFVDKNVKKMKL